MLLVFSFNLSEYLKVFIVWFAEEKPGPTQAIIMIFDLSDFLKIKFYIRCEGVS